MILQRLRLHAIHNFNEKSVQRCVVYGVKKCHRSEIDFVCGNVSFSRGHASQKIKVYFCPMLHSISPI